jgi:hypothetical protein
MEDLEVGPAVLRNGTRDGNAGVELLLSGEAVECAAADFFERVVGVVHEGEVLHLREWTSDEFAGEPYLYRAWVTE